MNISPKDFTQDQRNRAMEAATEAWQHGPAEGWVAHMVNAALDAAFTDPAPVALTVDDLAEARRQIERDFILVPRVRDEDADASLYARAFDYSADEYRTGNKGTRAGIKAVLSKYDSAGAGTRATGEGR